MGLHGRIAVMALILAGTGPAVAAPQSTPADEALARATAYVTRFIQRFSNVVSDEQYVQESSLVPRVTGTGFNKAFEPGIPIRRQLKSDFLLIRRAADAEWNTLRDVYEVDGRPVRDRTERLTRLLNRPPDEANEEARRIAVESARYNIGGGSRTINNPLTVIALLQKHMQGRFRFTSGKPDKNYPATVVVIDYREQVRPTILRANNVDLPMVGRLWIEAGTGQILKTELVAGGTDHVTTTFEFDDRFEIAMPHEMHESFVAGRSAVEGRATYGQFRRFTVTTGEQVGKTP
jgi:hypothetical protein